MRLPVHHYADDPLPTSLHSGYERLAIQMALREVQLQRRGRLRHALAHLVRRG
jgi:hypothetical protein